MDIAGRVLIRPPSIFEGLASSYIPEEDASTQKYAFISTGLFYVASVKTIIVELDAKEYFVNGLPYA